MKKRDVLIGKVNDERVISLKRWILFISGAALALSVSACGQTVETEAGGKDEKGSGSGKAPEEVYAKSVEAAEETGSLHADILTVQNMKMQPDGMEMDVTIENSMDLTRNPEAFHHQSETSIVSDDIQNDNPTSMEMYWTDEGLYLHEAAMDTWLRIQDEAIEDFKLLADQQTADPAHQLKALRAFADDFTMKETGGEYILELEASGEELFPLMVEQLKKTFGQMEIGTPMNSEDMEINSVQYEFHLNKKTFQANSLEMDADIEVKIDGETMAVQSEVEAAYSKHDKIKEIILPDKVREQVQELE
jgi:hypothetical protein